MVKAANKKHYELPNPNFMSPKLSVNDSIVTLVMLRFNYSPSTIVSYGFPK
jgi:hypothetical protein